MYLFSIEGGDGSGKGLAAEIVSEILQSEFCFTSVDTTAEPRRDHAHHRLRKSCLSEIVRLPWDSFSTR